MRVISGDMGKGIEIISIHIPKTAGRSFHRILKQVYGESLDKSYEKEHFFHGKSDDLILKDELPDGIKGIHGHLTIAQVKHIIELEEPKVITWVRVPVERVISNYYYFMKRIREGNTTEKQRSKINYKLLKYAAQPKRCNRMTTILDGMDIKDFFFIGIMERFDKDIKTLGKMMGWPDNIEIPHLNDSSSFKMNNDCATQYKDIDVEMRFEIARLNEADMNLFNNILKLRSEHEPVQ